ncbi:MAG: hypothetical protein U0V64_06775 [Cyclobacteriaceae bacterium]
MPSYSQYQEPLLDRGYWYQVREDLHHLNAGTRVRVMNAQHHQAPQSDEGGFIVEFPDGRVLRLDHDADCKIIENISRYLEKQGPFDWDAAVEELHQARAAALDSLRDEVKTEIFQHNEKVKARVRELIAQGLSPKEAYRQAANRVDS